MGDTILNVGKRAEKRVLLRLCRRRCHVREILSWLHEGLSGIFRFFSEFCDLVRTPTTAVATQVAATAATAAAAAIVVVGNSIAGSSR